MANSDRNDGAAQGEATNRRSLWEVSGLFFRLGLTAFGGPAAHTAMMHEEVVVRRGWLTDAEFLEMMAAANFIPGPNSTEVAIHIGYRRVGWRGLVAAGLCFILPAMVLCMGIASLYVRYGQFKITEDILYGVKPVVIAIVGQAVFKLGRAVVKSWEVAFVGVAALVFLFLGVNELAVLFGGGVLVLMMRVRRVPAAVVWPWKSLPGVAATAAVVNTGAGLMPLFLVFLKIGSVLFGSGYVLLAFLQSDFVEHHHWLTQNQLLDAVAVGQVTPGPVFTTATFIGYIVAGADGQPLGVAGAVAATVGIFVPAFVFVALTAPILPRLKKSKYAPAFLDGLNVASLALMAFVMVELSAAAMRDWVTLTIAVGSLVVLLRFKKLNSFWVVLAGAGIGALHAYVL